MNEYVEQLTDKIHDVIDQYRHDGELNYAELIGALEMIKLDISMEAMGVDEEDDDDGEPILVLDYGE